MLIFINQPVLAIHNHHAEILVNTNFSNVASFMKFKKISCVWKFAVLRNILSCDYLFTSPLQASATALTSPNHYLTHLPPSSKENIAKPTVGSFTTWNTLRRDLRRKSLSAWSSTFLSATFDTERPHPATSLQKRIVALPSSTPRFGGRAAAAGQDSHGGTKALRWRRRTRALSKLSKVADDHAQSCRLGIDYSESSDGEGGSAVVRWHCGCRSS